uniref:uncharacterized protein LOC122605454 n=1 Tax=Erigeron canadensis TaxID=72917 RepID=UPI001CB97824|nr:uncharacterized protein LOC122605454 [Erigeron canadensis]
MSLHLSTLYKQNKIKRSDLVDQLREYQIRSNHNWASVSFISSNARIPSSSRMDMMLFVIWELLILSLIVSSAISLYFSHMSLTLILATVSWLLLLCMKVFKQVKLSKKTKQMMMLPLSM